MVDERNIEQPGTEGEHNPGSTEEEGKSGEQAILGKFKTVDDLAKSYKELEAKNTQTSQETAELRRQLQELQTAVQQEETAKEPEDMNIKYWQNPASIIDDMETRLNKLLEPLVTVQIETQKVQLRQDPYFVKYENEVNTMLNSLPTTMRNQPGILGELFNLVKGRHQNEILEDRIKKLRTELMENKGDIILGSLEEPSGGETFTGKETTVRLTDEEKRIAEQFNSDLSPAEAHKKYAEKKARLEKSDRARVRR